MDERLLVFDKVVVLPRVSNRHPDVAEADVLAAVRTACAVRRRNFDMPCHYCLAGTDTKGRLIEVIGAEQEDGTLIVYHAMRLTAKMAAELGID